MLAEEDADMKEMAQLELEELEPKKEELENTSNTY